MDQNDEENKNYPFIGREQLVIDFWKTIELHEAVVVDAARRLGKTTIMQEMAKEPGDFFAIWVDLEDRKTPFDLFSMLYAATVDWKDGVWHRPFTRVKRMLSGLSGASGWGITLPTFKPVEWKSLLESHINHLLWRYKKRKRVVIFLDEFPLLLHTILRGESALEAKEVISTLRRLSDENKQKLVLVLAGSLGFHHVDNLIREEADVNFPSFNKSKIFRVPPLSKENAILAVEKYLEIAGVTEYEETVPAVIAELTNGIPFYLRSISLSCVSLEKPVTQAGIEALVRDAIQLPGDSLHIQKDHFKRLDMPDYYKADLAATTYDILRLLSEPDFKIHINDLFSRFSNDFERVANGRQTGEDETQNIDNSNTNELNDQQKGAEGIFNDLILDLQTDHLILRDDEDFILFKYEIVRRSWHYHRGGRA